MHTMASSAHDKTAYDQLVTKLKL